MTLFRSAGTCLAATFMLLVSGHANPHTAAAATQKQMIGQMLMMGLPGSAANGKWAKSTAADIRAGRIGSVLLLGHNFKSRQQVTELTRVFHKAAGKIPVFVALDMEGGSVQRLGKKLGYPSVPSALNIAASRSPQKAAAAFNQLAQISRDAGFNMNLAPVVDLLVNPDNPVIAKWRRSYGRDPEKVAAYARQFVDAHRRHGVIAVLKHFPGHGSSLRDSHDGFVDVSKSWKRIELEPFRMLIGSNHAPAIMPGHLVNSTLTGDTHPVSLSRKAIAGMLRGKMGFQGLVVTDDLQMNAIRKNYSYRDAVIRAINAGVDILMISNSAGADPKLPAKTVNMITEAVEAGLIKPQTIRSAYGRIMRAKAAISKRGKTAN